MNRKVLHVAITIVIALTVATFSGCQWFLDALGAGLFSLSGTAVNVAQPADSTEYWKGSEDISLTLADATITLTNVYDSTETYSATVDSYGDWTALNVSAGRYRITGEKLGWTFIPKEIDITGMLQSAEPILAFETPANASEILIVVEWKRPTSEAAIDVDSILVLDEDNNGVAESAVYSADVNYNTASGYTVPVRYTASTYATPSLNVELDRDVWGDTYLAATATTPLVETIRIKSNPFGTTGNGQLRYYLNAWSSATLTGDSFATTPIPSTYATVTVMQPSATASDGLLGIFNIALDSYEKTLGVVKIDVAYTTVTEYTVKSYGNEGSGVAKDL